MEKPNISRAVIKRLPRYLRYLTEMQKQGTSRVSSKQLAAKMGLTASQIRQDFNCFGGFGQQGYGYNIETLIEELRGILGTLNNKTAIIIGVGNIGKALLNNFNFMSCGFELLGGFDSNTELIGKNINDIMIYDVEKLGEFMQNHKPQLAVLTIPKAKVHEIAEILVHHDIKAIWNFTNCDIEIGEKNIPVESVRFSDSLMTLCYYIEE